MFAERGFAGTTISVIAQRAGVAPQTIYATFGSKAAILTALLSGLEEAADVATWRERLDDASDPRRLLSLFAQWTASMLDTSRELIAAAQTAANSPDLAELAAQGDRQRRAALGSLVNRIADGGSLRTDLSRTRATDRAWILTAAGPYLAVTGDCGWSLSTYTEWLAETLRQQLLESPDRDPQMS
jgi:AcrR family transcriptional regulator